MAYIYIYSDLFGDAAQYKGERFEKCYGHWHVKVTSYVLTYK